MKAVEYFGVFGRFLMSSTIQKQVPAMLHTKYFDLYGK
jgi:hypothetical protein